MKGIKIYAPPERAAPVDRFIDGLDVQNVLLQPT